MRMQCSKQCASVKNRFSRLATTQPLAKGRPLEPVLMQAISMMIFDYRFEMRSQRTKLDWTMTKDVSFSIKQSPAQCRLGVEASGIPACS